MFVDNNTTKKWDIAKGREYVESIFPNIREKHPQYLAGSLKYKLILQ